MRNIVLGFVSTGGGASALRSYKVGIIERREACARCDAEENLRTASTSLATRGGLR
jgi:hypothetical protein